MESSRTPSDKDVIGDINKLYFVVATVFVLLLITIYFVVASTEPPEDGIWHISRMFVLDMLSDVIPVFLLFLGSYVLLRRIQARQAEQSIEKITKKIRAELDDLSNRTPFMQNNLLNFPKETITNVYFQQTNEERNRQKRYTLKKS